MTVIVGYDAKLEVLNLPNYVGDCTVSVVLVDFVTDGSDQVYSSQQWRLAQGLSNCSIIRFDDEFKIRNNFNVKEISNNFLKNPDWKNFIKIVITVNAIDETEIYKFQDEFIEIPEGCHDQLEALVGNQFSEKNDALLSYSRFYLFGTYKNPISYKNKNILLSGCGTGAEAVVCILLGARKCTGFDIDEAAINFAKKRFNSIGCIEFQAVEYFKENEYDLVISRHVLEHINVDAWSSYLLELSSYLKVGGDILLDFPNQMNPREPHTELLFFHLLPDIEKRRILEYCNAVQPDWYLKIKKKLDALAVHKNVNIKDFLSQVPNGLHLKSVEYIDSTSHFLRGGWC